MSPSSNPSQMVGSSGQGFDLTISRRRPCRSAESCRAFQLPHVSLKRTILIHKAEKPLRHAIHSGHLGGFVCYNSCLIRTLDRTGLPICPLPPAPCASCGVQLRFFRHQVRRLGHKSRRHIERRKNNLFYGFGMSSRNPIA